MMHPYPWSIHSLLLSLLPTLLVAAAATPPFFPGMSMWPVQNHLLTLDPHPSLIVRGRGGGRRVLRLDAVPLPGTGYLHVDLNAVLPRLIPHPEEVDRSDGGEADTSTEGEERQGGERRERRQERRRERRQAVMEKGRRRAAQALVGKHHDAPPSHQPQLLCLPLSSPLLRSATRQLSRIHPYSVTHYLNGPGEVVVCYRQRDLRAVGCIL